ncbi:hypothetical protein [Parashewanella tropica]|uniref:hypothetical protein n=1 Tax=Parashewanella tropica TaxID=2547970 RepID=UPI001C550B86|nr:hypothetical protein [Parashewanella tropica]
MAFAPASQSISQRFAPVNAALYAKEVILYLYRGMNSTMYKELEGKLIPKKFGESFSSVPCAGDPHAECGSGIVAGDATINEVIFHQWGQKGFPTSGISTTPNKERARFYALSGGENTEGYIFKLSIENLKNENVSIHKVNALVTNPSIPEDDEHILVAKDFLEIPKSAIVSIEKV